MKYGRKGRKARFEEMSRRALRRIIVAAVLVFLTSYGLWLLLGQPHRHGKQFHVEPIGN